jgi:hypothetical protein
MLVRPALRKPQLTVAVGALQRDDVGAWRRLQLQQAGFPPGLAAQIGRDGRYDVHALIELAERGCEPALAARILAPLEGNEAA